VNGTSISFDFSTMTGYSGTSSPAVTKTDGYQAGVLTQYQIGQDGVITGFFSNSEKENLGQIALVTFNNPNGLYKQGNSTYTSSPDSGLPEVGAPVSGGRGSITAGALEMSNVDLAAEFTNMIIAQRGFSANAKVITTSDEILQDLVNIKR
jgi:flagellar hook protein FlgE